MKVILIVILFLTGCEGMNHPCPKNPLNDYAIIECRDYRS